MRFRYLTLFLITFFSINSHAQSAKFTVGQVLELMKQNVKPQWMPTKTDTIVIGNDNENVTGIATCMFVDMGILKRAVAAHCNVIITHEPTFYEGSDKVPAFLNEDKVLNEKRDYINQHKLNIIRFHDNSHRNQPDQILQGLANELGGKVVATSPWIVEVKKQSLVTLASTLKKQWGIAGIRVIGKPDLAISRIALVPGMAPTMQLHLGPLQRSDVDAILVGEAREWEDYVYAKDALEQGRPKGAIFIGHLKSEEPGMKYCAEWMKTFVKGVNVVFLENKNYWWTPE